MSLFTPALDNMFAQTLPKRSGTKESCLNDRAATKRGAATLAGQQSLVRNARAADLLGRNSRFASSRIARLAGK